MSINTLKNKYSSINSTNSSCNNNKSNSPSSPSECGESTEKLPHTLPHSKIPSSYKPSSIPSSKDSSKEKSITPKNKETTTSNNSPHFYMTTFNTSKTKRNNFPSQDIGNTAIIEKSVKNSNKC